MRRIQYGIPLFQKAFWLSDRCILVTLEWLKGAIDQRHGDPGGMGRFYDTLYPIPAHCKGICHSFGPPEVDSGMSFRFFEENRQCVTRGLKGGFQPWRQ